MNKDRLSAKFDQELSEGRIRDLFIGGGCYYFALWIHSERLRESTYERCVDTLNGAGHVYLVTSRGLNVDIDGAHERQVFQRSLEERFQIDPRDLRVEPMTMDAVIDRIAKDAVRFEVRLKMKQAALAAYDRGDGFRLVGAFALTAGSGDSSLLLDLAPGAYTVQVSGVGNTTGNGLVEVYEVPPQ